MRNLNPLIITPIVFVVVGWIGYITRWDILLLSPGVGIYGGIYWSQLIYIILLGIFVGWVLKKWYTHSNKAAWMGGLLGIAIYIAWLFLPSGQSFQDTFGFMLATIGLGYLPLPSGTTFHIQLIIVFIIFFFATRKLLKLPR